MDGYFSLFLSLLSLPLSLSSPLSLSLPLFPSLPLSSPPPIFLSFPLSLSPPSPPHTSGCSGAAYSVLSSFPEGPLTASIQAIADPWRADQYSSSNGGSQETSNHLLAPPPQRSKLLKVIVGSTLSGEVYWYIISILSCTVSWLLRLLLVDSMYH